MSTSDPAPPEGAVASDAVRPDWRIECRACGAWFVTYLRSDIENWLTSHAHAKPPQDDSGPDAGHDGPWALAWVPSPMHPWPSASSAQTMAEAMERERRDPPDEDYQQGAS